MRNTALPLLFAVLLSACKGSEGEFDASGTFEATEIIISSEVNGKILKFSLEEGDNLRPGQHVGFIDSTQYYLTKIQLKQNREAILAGRPDVKTQIESTKKEIESVQFEKKRIEALIKGEVATRKQLDDVNSKLAVLEARLAAQQNGLQTSTRTLNEQGNAVEAQLALVEDQLKKCVIVNPVSGTVLSKYASANEITGGGKPLYKIADLSNVTLRAYITGTQLPAIKLGQTVNVLVDANKEEYKSYPGTIAWISEKAEFTPKTIQTKDERSNLVYAIKISVKNDGFLKIGMYGEVKF